MENLRLYNTIAEYENDNKVIPQVSYIIESDEVKYEIETPPLDERYLTFNILSSGTLCWKASTSDGRSMFYSLNGGVWAVYNSSTSGNVLNLTAGDVIKFKGTNPSYGDNSFFTTFSGSTAKFDVEGNIMSIIYGDNFKGKKAFTASHVFLKFFANTQVVNAENLILPVETMTSDCYSNMFANCQSLVSAPALPATTLARNCYSGMFNGCRSLTTAPELPATTLEKYCYPYMFTDCSNLTTAPELPAETVLSYSYYYMFSNCRSLNAITCLATNVSAGSSTRGWLYGVAATGTFTKAASMSNWTSGANGIPNGWEIENYTS